MLEWPFLSPRNSIKFSPMPHFSRCERAQHKITMAELCSNPTSTPSPQIPLATPPATPYTRVIQQGAPRRALFRWTIGSSGARTLGAKRRDEGAG